MENIHLQELNKRIEGIKETNRKLAAMMEKYGIEYDPNIDVDATLKRLMDSYGITYDPNYDVRTALDRMMAEYKVGDE